MPLVNTYVVVPTAATTLTNVIWTGASTTCATITATSNAIYIQQQMNQIELWQQMMNQQPVYGGLGQMCNNQAVNDDPVRMQNRAQPQPPAAMIAAKARARDLLLARLTADQRDTFTKNGWFVVTGGRSGKRYRIRDGSLVANIDVLAPGDHGITHRLCGHLTDHGCPLEDHLLAQKLLLEHDEERFLAVANIHR